VRGGHERERTEFIEREREFNYIRDINNNWSSRCLGERSEELFDK